MIILIERVLYEYHHNRMFKAYDVSITLMKHQHAETQRTTEYRALLRKMTCKDKASYESTPPCITLMKHQHAETQCALCDSHYHGKSPRIIWVLLMIITNNKKKINAYYESIIIISYGTH